MDVDTSNKSVVADKIKPLDSLWFRIMNTEYFNTAHLIYNGHSEGVQWCMQTVI